LLEKPASSIALIKEPVAHTICHSDHFLALWQVVITFALFAVWQDEFVANFRDNIGVVYTGKLYRDVDYLGNCRLQWIILDIFIMFILLDLGEFAVAYLV